MANKASDASGWVVEVVTLRQEQPPVFKYFNAAIPSVTNAVQATRKLPGVADANRVEAVRALSGAEIAALKLRSGEVRPA
jgi:hypothetical protein